MKTGRKLLLAAGLAGVALTAGAFLAFKGRAMQPGNALFGMQPVSPAAGGFAVVELFTSEGCSSCPPADALVAAVQKEDKDLPVYVLAFHVDYWDRLGWKDAFSDAAYSDRQKDYARWLRLSSIYTPQVIVNGRKEFVGSDAVTLRRAIGSSLQEAGKAGVSLSQVRLSGNRLDWQAHVVGAGRSTGLVVAVVEHSAVTKVRAGENGGKTLSHIQIVRGLETVKLDGKGNAGGHLDWPGGVDPADGEVIAFLQDEDNGQIVAATRSAVK
ncbi:DUF1223 domain-containing protein [Puia dinghuensis]|nr:DUF1223 domain-containing protein [Puia dinghuensis]